MTELAVNVQNTSYYYGRDCALNNINFTLKSGQFLALLGANGAGKTTLFSLLTRLLQSPSGSIELFGHHLQASPGKALQQMGIVFQQSTLDLDLTVAQNLAYHGALHGLSSRKTKQRMAVELQRFDLSNRAGDKVRELNGGHRRRLEIARALLHSPRLLLLDEATVGLDIETRQNINKHIRQLCIDENIAVLWTTHLIEELGPGDDILILNQGDIIARGSGQQLMEQHHVPDMTTLVIQLTGLQP
ncbi:MAG: ATP-binding cassette domain-containing protein [Porticoccus sp.]|nr:ATP-binding cassette domain-containing protein [Porticoccus sp.]